MSKELDRRSFLNVSAGSLAGAVLAEAAFGQGAPPAKVVRFAFVGVGNRGSYHLDCALGIEGVEVVAVCDVDDKALYRAKRWVEEAGQPSPRLYGESKTAYRALCEKETVVQAMWPECPARIGSDGRFLIVDRANAISWDGGPYFSA